MVQKIKSVVISAFISSLIIVLWMSMAFAENGSPRDISHLGQQYNVLFTWITISLFLLGVPTSALAGKLLGKLPTRSDVARRIFVLLLYLAVAVLLSLFIGNAIRGGFVIFIVVAVVYFVVNDWLLNRANQWSKSFVNRFIQLGLFCYLASIILAGLS